MPVCAAKNCNNGSKNFSTDSYTQRLWGKSFHLFPHKNPELLKKWTEAVGREGWRPKKHDVLCSDHFKESDIIRTGQSARLHKGTVPSVFEPLNNTVQTKITIPCDEIPSRSSTLSQESTENVDPIFTIVDLEKGTKEIAPLKTIDGDTPPVSIVLLKNTQHFEYIVVNED